MNPEQEEQITAEQNLSKLMGKVIKKVHYQIGYGSATIEFTDGTKLDIWAEEEYSFHVDINDKSVTEE